MTLPDISTINKIKLSNSNQLGILVPNIPKAVVYYSKILNIGPWFRSKTVKHEAFYRGRQISLDLDIVLAFQGGMEIELIQVKGGDECVYSDLLRKSGGGIHHLGFLVSSYDARLANMKEAGIGVLQSGAIFTKGSAVTRYAYLDTTEQCGIITEIIETKLMGLLMPHSRLIMSIGCMTGDVERIKA
jgi:methylmalonyl-CoA/ethylmalonyl-CoA epimerase